MKFPFPQKVEYIDVYDKTNGEERLMYKITNEQGIVWIKHINVENYIFVKE